ncbi:MAG: YbhB/YbcL family Raf kinase inhibitor-like protein [Candidatus Yonathbacteria bacterium]|nr:YbhB/YbcL family Raf kinase inhibitor-like protein [Candidatus Yonathbacteria bacterium]
MSLTITSPAFEMNGSIPSRFTCDGDNISPALNFSNIPEGTQSFALTMEDPDVPKTVRADGMWNHLLVWNIPPQTTRIEEGKNPPGIVGANTGGKMLYAGPCPPDREHRYIFTLYALDSLLSLPNSATKEELFQEISPHLIEQAKLY